MKKWNTSFFTLCALLFTTPMVGAADYPIELLQKDLYFLASKECEGRGLKTEGINKAANYIAQSFRDAGLKSGVPDGTYFQPFGVKDSYLKEGKQVVAITTKGGAIAPAYLKDFTVSGLSGAGEISGELVLAGYGIKTEKYDDYAGIDVKGKIVVVMRQAPQFRKRPHPLFDENQLNEVASLSSKIQTAEKLGAKGVIFINDLDRAGKSDTLMEYSYARDRNAIGKLPVVHWKREIVDTLLKSSKTTLADWQEKIDSQLKPASVALADVKVEITTNVGVRELPVKNVVAVLEGKGPLANETVVLGAHYDHLGRGEAGSLAAGSTDIHYGADDNASGTTGLLALARYYGSQKDREGRRLVFIAFTGEESGLLGSLHYASNPLFPLKDTVAMLNMDMIGRLRVEEKSKKDSLRVGGVGSAKNFEALLDEKNKAAGLHLVKDKSGTGPSDHTSFYTAKVPVYFFFTGEHQEYHTPKDLPETINFKGITRVIDLVRTLCDEIAAAPTRPEYVAGMTGSMSAGRRGPKLGVMPSYGTPDIEGMVVGGIIPGGAAEAGGMKKGDIIVNITGKRIRNINDYMAVMGDQKVDEEIDVTVTRDGKEVKLKVKPK
ncbi:MAG: M28 family peptidase [Zavarzinella sp.]